MEKPNLFNFATSELSQDAFICWLLSWAKPCYKTSHPQLNACATEILRLCFEKHGREFPAEIQSVEITKQDANIDVLCIVNETYPVLIEDKTHTSQHSDQLQHYFDDILKRGFAAENILPIYFKTRDQSDYTPITAAGYQPFLREDLLAILNRCENIGSEVFQDFRVCLNGIERSVRSFRCLPFPGWRWDQWVGFYVQLRSSSPMATGTMSQIPLTDFLASGFHGNSRPTCGGGT